MLLRYRSAKQEDGGLLLGLYVTENFPEVIEWLTYAWSVHIFTTYIVIARLKKSLNTFSPRTLLLQEWRKHSTHFHHVHCCKNEVFLPHTLLLQGWRSYWCKTTFMQKIKFLTNCVLIVMIMHCFGTSLISIIFIISIRFYRSYWGWLSVRVLVLKLIRWGWFNI